ncbi:hypothetical protein OG875_04635 [Streptomyces sp. NBC_01498]|uniref:hypothetical protein n=1 Tax=Streptomyces sp. NBC_01498 TaxID=2975870 RepID=UPI002E7AD6BF|nr:hypothetical protein [Streptomyces sp. NBC_01498]WTL23942.1 hypothetical protein OG875_04635 [Streptomyces sp. NBC_01498]
MISDSGRYWSAGIAVTWVPASVLIGEGLYGGWHAVLTYYDDGFFDTDPETGQVSTWGTLRTRSPVRDAKIRSGLSIAVDALLADAQRLGIEFPADSGSGPQLGYEEDMDREYHPPPKGWRETLTAEAERIGFQSSATPTEEN